MKLEDTSVRIRKVDTCVIRILPTEIRKNVCFPDRRNNDVFRYVEIRSTRRMRNERISRPRTVFVFLFFRASLRRPITVDGLG